MSKHIGRNQRWTTLNSTEHTSALGRVVYQKQAWYGLLSYRLASLGEDGRPVWTAHDLRLGPFKRPRNAMVALEQEATFLRNRHANAVLFGNEAWAER